MSALSTLARRAGLGLAVGAAAGFVIYLFYNQRWKKRLWTKDSNGNFCDPQPSPIHHELQDPSAESFEKLGRREADGAALFSAAVCVEQAAVLDRLDFVLQSVAELRREVGELRNSLQSLSVDIVGQVTAHITESQKGATRRRRYFFHRERSDSTGSSSVYFTATPGPATTDGESEGGYTTANPESDYDRESDRESEEEDSCETVKMARGDSMELVNDEETTLTLDPPEFTTFIEFNGPEKETEIKGQE